MSLATSMKLTLTALQAVAGDLAAAQDPLRYTFEDTLADGTGADQADLIFHDQRTLSASATEDLDLAGVLADKFGNTLTFARVKAIIVKAAAGNTNNVLVGGASSAQFATFFGDTSDILVVRPGGFFMLFAPDATGYAVTATTADLLKIANSSSGSAVTYDIIIIGASA